MTTQRFNVDRTDSAIAGAIQSSAGAEQLMRLLCHQVGPRPAGSAAMRQAAAELSKVWSALGTVDVHEEPVPVDAWQEAASRVKLVGPRQVTYDSVQAINSASETIEGPLLVTPGVSDQTLDQLGDRVRGSVVLTGGHEISGGKHITTQQRVCRLQDAGAAAVILASGHPTLPAIEFMYKNNPVTIPVVNISGQDGKALAGLIAETPSSRVRVRTGGHSFPTECINVVGDLGPEDKSGELIVLSAHLDSFYLSPGAFDNLTGIVTLTEIARALAPYRHRFARRLRIIAFTGEEIGFAGSKHYVQTQVVVRC